MVDVSLPDDRRPDNRRVVVSGSLLDQTSDIPTPEMIGRAGGPAVFKGTISRCSLPTTLGRVTAREGDPLILKSGFLIDADNDLDSDAAVRAFAKGASFGVACADDAVPFGFLVRYRVRIVELTWPGPPYTA